MIDAIRYRLNRVTQYSTVNHYWLNQREDKAMHIPYLADICGAKAPLCPADLEGAAHEQEEAVGNHARVIPRLRRHVCIGKYPIHRCAAKKKFNLYYFLFQEDMNRVMAAWDKIDSKQNVGDDE